MFCLQAGYCRWVMDHGGDWLKPVNVEVALDKVREVYCIDEGYELVESGYEVNAWFRHDWIPLNAEGIERGLALLDWSREDLLAMVNGLSRDSSA